MLDWSASTAPSTCSTSNSITSATAGNARTANTWRSRLRGRGPVARGEACADSFYAALESAVSKLENRLRRSKDRRKIHYGDKTPVSLAEATAITQLLEPAPAPVEEEAPAPEDHEPGRIVRTKEHTATPMTVDDALYEMELVGHDFFLFHDEESDKPTVVYRRHAYDYGLIRLA